MSYTPGPWKADGPYVSDEHYFYKGHWEVDFPDGHSCLIPVTDNAEANARLIAAAPDLYRELCGVREDLALLVREGHIEYYDFTAMDAAIASAKGDE